LATIRVDDSGPPVFDFRLEFGSLPVLGQTVSENAGGGAYDSLLSGIEYNIAAAVVSCFNSVDAHHEVCLNLEALNGLLAQFTLSRQADGRLRELAGR
jgi:hypothetical protein